MWSFLIIVRNSPEVTTLMHLQMKKWKPGKPNKVNKRNNI